jgi:hypothetical protein
MEKNLAIAERNASMASSGLAREGWRIIATRLRAELAWRITATRLRAELARPAALAHLQSRLDAESAEVQRRQAAMAVPAPAAAVSPSSEAAPPAHAIIAAPLRVLQTDPALIKRMLDATLRVAAAATAPPAPTPTASTKPPLPARALRQAVAEVGLRVTPLTHR